MTPIAETKSLVTKVCKLSPPCGLESISESKLKFAHPTFSAFQARTKISSHEVISREVIKVEHLTKLVRLNLTKPLVRLNI